MPHNEVVIAQSTPVQVKNNDFQKDIPKKPLPGSVYEEEQITLEKSPMTRGDESLVFLAGAMLLAIILILGYMYSNGRL